MKKIHIYISLAIAFLFCTDLLNAEERQKNITFDTPVYNFGSINSRAGDIDYTFFFTNTTGVPINIKSITATCACTVPVWTRDTIPPMGIGKVKVELKMSKLAGYFSKVIDVYTSLSEQPVFIQVTGRVMRNGRYDDPFKNKLGHLLSNGTIFDFGQIKEGKERKIDLKFINNRFDTVHFLIKKQPKQLRVEQTRTAVAPGGNVMITLTIDSTMKKRRIAKMREIELHSILPQKDTIVFSIPIKTEFIK